MGSKHTVFFEYTHAHTHTHTHTRTHTHACDTSSNSTCFEDVWMVRGNGCDEPNGCAAQLVVVVNVSARFGEKRSNSIATMHTDVPM